MVFIGYDGRTQRYLRHFTIYTIEHDAISVLSDIPDVTTAVNLMSSEERKITSEPTLSGRKEIEGTMQTRDSETCTSYLEDSSVFDKFLLDKTNTATIDDLRNPGEEKAIYDAFVSVNFDSRNDLRFVKEMAAILENKFKMKLFIPLRDSIPGSAEHSMSAYLIDVRCKKVIVILSKSFLKSSACDFQLRFAHCLHPSVRTQKIIPVMIEPDTPVPLLLRFVTVCDFTQTEMAEWVLERLICTLRAPVPAIVIGEEDPSDDYSRSTDLQQIKLEVKVAAFKEVFCVEIDEDQTNNSCKSSYTAKFQNTSSFELDEKIKEKKKCSEKRKKRQELQKAEDEFQRIAQKLAHLTTLRDLKNETDAKTTSEKKKHRVGMSGDAKYISESQSALDTNCKKRMTLNNSHSDAVLRDLQETMSFNLYLYDHTIDRSHNTPSTQKCSATAMQDVECKVKKQKNQANCEVDLNTTTVEQANFHNLSTRSPARVFSHTSNTQGRSNKNNESVRQKQFPIPITSDQRMYPSSLTRSDDIHPFQGSDEITAENVQLDKSNTNRNSGSYQFITNQPCITKDHSKETQLQPIQCAHTLTISSGAEIDRAYLGTSVNAKGATVLHRLERNALGREPVFV